MALSNLPTGGPQSARGELHTARNVFANLRHKRGLSLCLELDALLALQSGDVSLSRDIQDELDLATECYGYTPLDHYFAQDARALKHLQKAEAAAQESACVGVQAKALCNLGVFQQELFDVEKACAASEKALDLAKAYGLKSVVSSAAANLIVVNHAAGRHEQAWEWGRFLTENPQLQPAGALTRAAMPNALACYANGDVERAQEWLSSGSTPGVNGHGTTFWAWLSAMCFTASRRVSTGT